MRKNHKNRRITEHFPIKNVVILPRSRNPASNDAKSSNWAEKGAGRAAFHSIHHPRPLPARRTSLHTLNLRKSSSSAPSAAARCGTNPPQPVKPTENPSGVSKMRFFAPFSRINFDGTNPPFRNRRPRVRSASAHAYFYQHPLKSPLPPSMFNICAHRFR
jgi:hypothetical protein